MMTFVSFLSFFVIPILTILFFIKRLLSYNESPSMKKLFDGLPEISPHWFWGNASLSEQYKTMKGLRFCVWYTGRKRKLLVMDPEIINKITVTDFNHFVDVAFLDAEYTKVIYDI